MAANMKTEVLIPNLSVDNGGSRVPSHELVDLLRLQAPCAVGVARQFVQPHFSPTKIKLVKSNLLDTKQGG